MPTYPLPTLAPTVSVAGISAPTYNDVLQSLIASFQAIYGSSIYVAPDSQDGQWIAVLAKAVHDSNQAAVAVFQAFSPTYSQGVGLSSLVKLNGLSRKAPTNSTAQGKVIGQAGTVITNGIVQDANANQWALPGTVTIPLSGELVVGITAVPQGALQALAGTINNIYNPQLGWQSFESTIDAVPGAPVESDTELRIRQSLSTSTPALTVKEAIFAAVANTAGVTVSTVYENDTGRSDANGVPAHSISVIAKGGDPSAIAAAIASKKTPGTGTYGSTTIPVFDSNGLPTNINFFVLQLVPVYFTISIRPLAGYAPTTAALIRQAISDFVNSLEIGEDAYPTQVAAAASLISSPLGQTFYILSFSQGLAAHPGAQGILSIAFNQQASCSPDNVSIILG